MEKSCVVEERLRFWCKFVITLFGEGPKTLETEAERL